MARSLICVQGLGFVGAAMAAAVASARRASGEPRFDVVGIDLPTPDGQARAAALDAGGFPFACPDPALEAAIVEAHEAGNLHATTDAGAYAEAAVVIVDIPLDVRHGEEGPEADFAGFRRAIRSLGEVMQPGALVIVETTVPPGTCERVAAPELAAALEARGLAPDAVLLAHSFERVMPGPGYLDSIVSFWRVYAGRDEASADACREFLEAIIDTDAWPLTRLASTTASETAKVLENSYRAVNIAFIEEWARLAEAAGIDLFEVIEAIRLRPTHSNIRQPGFGVGGYCLPKDPLFAGAAARTLLGQPGLAFPFNMLAVGVNQDMPIRNLDRLEGLLDGSLDGRRLILLGVAYRSEVDDTRHAPAAIFCQEAMARGASVICHDPHVRDWAETGLPPIDRDLPGPDGADAVVFAVPHMAFREMDVGGWLGTARPLVFDCDNVLAGETRRALRTLGCRVESTGRGTGL